jgi:hypothetical protein
MGAAGTTASTAAASSHSNRPAVKCSQPAWGSGGGGRCIRRAYCAWASSSMAQASICRSGGLVGARGSSGSPASAPAAGVQSAGASPRASASTRVGRPEVWQRFAGKWATSMERCFPGRIWITRSGDYPQWRRPEAWSPIASRRFCPAPLSVGEVLPTAAPPVASGRLRGSRR